MSPEPEPDAEKPLDSAAALRGGLPQDESFDSPAALRGEPAQDESFGPPAALRGGPAQDESPIVASLVFLAADVVAWGGLAVHTVLSRRRFRKFIDEGNLEFPADLFLGTPGALYAAAFLLLVVGLLVKEVAVERKEVTLALNVAALLLAVALLALWWFGVRTPFERILAS